MADGGSSGFKRGRDFYISLSKLDRYRRCRRNAWYHYEVGARPLAVSSNLVYGSVGHKALELYWLGQIDDPVAGFEHLWLQAQDEEAIQFNKTMNADDLMATGKLSIERFVEFWEESGLLPAIDRNGKPAVELNLAARIDHDVVLWGRIDLIANLDGRTLILDAKFPAQGCSDIFPLVADQLTDYQVLVEANDEYLGLGPMDGLGYIEIIKRKAPKTARGKGPTVHLSEIAPPRTPRQIGAWVSKVRGEIADIRAGRFPKDPGPAYRNACDECDFKMHCIYGIEDGLVIPDGKRELLNRGPADVVPAITA